MKGARGRSNFEFRFAIDFLDNVPLLVLGA